MKPPRGLNPDEAALGRKVTDTVRPLNPPRYGEGDHPQGGGGAPSASPDAAVSRKPKVPLPHAAHGSPLPKGEDRGKTPPLSSDRGLDTSWERKLARAAIAPDFTLDLHGHSLEQAHARLDMGLGQAKAMGARLVLLVTGKPRPVHAADRGERRGAIRAKVLDWLAAGPHAADIAAIRKAHRRHGGEGALYLVLKRRR